MPEHIRAALAGGLLADAYAAAAADPPPPDAASATAPRTHAAGATPLPADLRWPCAEELGVTAAVSELAAAGGAASVQQVDARLPPFSLEMQSACACHGAHRDCLLELWAKPDSEAWISYKKCEAAEAEVRRIVADKPRRRQKTEVKDGFDVIGGYVGSDGRHLSQAPVSADSLGATQSDSAPEPEPAPAPSPAPPAPPPVPADGDAVDDTAAASTPAAAAQGSLTKHRRTCTAAKEESNRVAEEEIVRLSKLELLGRKTCLETLCFLVRRSESWLRQRPRVLKGQTEAERRPSRLHRLELHRSANRTSMENLCPIEDLGLGACKCGRACLFNAKPSDLRYFRSKLGEAMRSGASEKMFEVVQQILITYEDICTAAVAQITGHSRSTIDAYRQYATLGACRQAHGNTGRSPWNTSAPWVLAAIEDTLNCCTMKDPESKVRRPVNATAAGVRKMFEMMCSGNVDTGRTVADLRAAPACTDLDGKAATAQEAFADRARKWCSLSTFARGIAMICRSEGCKLLRAQTGHNKCPYCLEMEQEILSTYAEWQEARKKQFSDEQMIAERQKGHEAALRKYQAHLSKDYWTRGYINCLKRLTEAVNETYDSKEARNAGVSQLLESLSAGGVSSGSNAARLTLRGDETASCICSLRAFAAARLRESNSTVMTAVMTAMAVGARISLWRRSPRRRRTTTKKRSAALLRGSSERRSCRRLSDTMASTKAR